LFFVEAEDEAKMQDLLERKTFHSGRWRDGIFSVLRGFLGAAIGYLWASEGLIAARLPETKNDLELERIVPRLPVRINSVIFLFMCGGSATSILLIPRTTSSRGR
jgi:hypothetical protein